MAGKGLSETRVLWGIGTPRTMRPHWALHELSLPYETRPVAARTGDTLARQFTALSLRQKIPLLQDGEFVISESAAIIAYLSDRYSSEGESLVPADRLDRARWMDWCFFIMTELDATSLYVIRRHCALKDLYGSAPAAVESAQKYFMKQVKHVDQVLSDGRSYLLGDRFTTADILLTTCLVWAAALSLRNGCIDYLQRTTRREAYRSAYTANYPPCSGSNECTGVSPPLVASIARLRNARNRDRS